MYQLHAINKEVANDVLTEIQNGVVTKVKTEQMALKKSVKNELKTITNEIDTLNKKLEEALDDETRSKLEEDQETFKKKYTQYFQREAEKLTMFRHINLEKPTKWFLNLSSKK